MANDASAVQIAVKKQVALGTRATGSGATELLVAASPGIAGQMAPIVSPTIRRDGLKTLDGLGSRSGGASYGMAMSIDKATLFWPSLIRGTEQASFTITNADVTSITTQLDGVTVGSGSLLTAFSGKRIYRGMMFKLTSHSTAGNNGKWLPVLGVTSTKIITLNGALAVDAVADTSFTITFARCWFSGAAPTKDYYTIEEWYQQILASEILDDAVITKFDLGGGPNAKLLGTFTFMGRDFAFDDTTGTPVFTSPSSGVGRELELSDGILIKDGVAQNKITELSMSYDMGGEIEPVLGPVGDDVSLGLGGASGNINVKRTDLALLKAYRAKTPFELMVIAKEPEAEPADFVSFYLGNCLSQAGTKNIAQTGTTKDSLPFTAGVDLGGGDRVKTVMVISTSSAT